MDLNDQEIKEFNLQYALATKKMNGILISDSYRPKCLSFFEKMRARKAIKHFNNALAIAPKHWQSLFFIGKIYQRLADYEKALSYMEKALEYENSNFNILQEASLVAMNLNLIEKAIYYSEAALRKNPDSIELMGNHAMNLLIAGKDLQAQQIIETALALEPHDVINKNIQEKIFDVYNGKITRPTFKDFS